MKFRPCIDLHDGKVKQIVGGNATLTENFVSEQSASYFARLYAEAGLVGGHVIKLGEGNDEAARAALEAFPKGLQVGGGITAANAKEWLDAGASHVIVTSWAFVAGELDVGRLADLVAQIGRDRLVLDLSCRKRDDAYYVVTDRWQTFSSLRVDKTTLATLAEYCCEFLVHGVDVEGKRLGIDDTLVELLGSHSPLPVTYAGGVRSLADVDRVRLLGRGRVDLTIGSALDIFGGDLPLADVLGLR